MNKKCLMCEKFFEKKPSDSRTYWERKTYCSISCSKKGKPAWNKGIELPFEVWNKGKTGLQIAWNKGNGEYAKRLGFGKWMKGRKGATGNHWKGDEVGYGALHDWVYRELGRPNKCIHCGLVSNNPYKMQWANLSGQYKRDLDDWIRLCAKCHKKYDKDMQKRDFRKR